MDKPTTSAGTTHESDSQETPSLGSSGGELIATAAGAGQELQSQVVGLTHQVRQQATEQITSQKARVVDTLEMVALLLRQSGEHAHLQEKAMLAGYLDKASGEVGKWSKMIEEQDPTQLVDQTKQFANRQPLMFVGGALALGFLGTRFLRSSAQQLSPSTAETAGALNATNSNPSEEQGDSERSQKTAEKSSASRPRQNMSSSPDGDRSSNEGEERLSGEETADRLFDDASYDDALSTERP